MGTLDEAETLAVSIIRAAGTEPERRLSWEAIGVATPAPTPPRENAILSSAAGFGSSLAPGSGFGPRYRIDSVLGCGGMGQVYKAYDRELDRTVALKLIRPELTLDPESIRRFKQELLLASRISHKNILRIHDLGDVNGIKFISMAYIEGQDLFCLLKKQGRCSVDETLGIARQLVAALDAAHSEGVIHRDLKPQNVLIDPNGHAYISDFGLAKSLETSAGTMTRAGEILGTPRYMAPEQMEGKSADHRSDLYALGLILYEMTTGDVPFSGESIAQMMAHRITQPVKAPKLANPEVPEYLSNLILRCLEANPARRYSSAREIARNLEAGRASRPTHTRSFQITLPALESRRSKLAAIAAVLVLTVLIVGLLAYTHARPRLVATPGGVPGVPSLGRGKFLALLPFHVLGDRASLGYLAEGLTEALGAKLFGLKGVHVTAPDAVERAARNGSIAQVAKNLGVNLVVEGTVQGSSRKIAVIINLQDLSHGRLLWAGEFTGVPGDLLTLEDQISAKLISALELHPAGQELAREIEHPTENTAAYNLYLKGREALRGLPGRTAIQQALGFYKGALNQDPGFALAYAGLADANLRMYNERKDRLWVDEAIHAARQAQELGSNLPQVYMAVGNVYSATGRNAEAVEMLQQALKLAPDSDEGYRLLGRAYQASGSPGKAIAAFKKAFRIDPYYWVNADELGKAYYAAGEYRRALKEFQQVIRIEPNDAAGHENIGNVYMQEGKYNQAIPALERALKLNPSFQHYSNLGSAYFYARRYTDAARSLEKAVALSPSQEAVVGNLAEAYFFEGQKGIAQNTFNQAVALAYKQLQVNPRDGDTMADLAIYSASLGDSVAALQFIRNARSIDPLNPLYAYNEAVVQSLLGKPAQAIASLRQAFEKGFPPLQAASDPELASLQSQPGFKKLVSQFARRK
ncbi:MAG: protein kinase domain-containing protein [Terriglobia bacterium]